MMQNLPIVCISYVLGFVGVFDMCRSGKMVCRGWRDSKIYQSTIVIPRDTNKLEFEEIMNALILSQVRNVILKGCLNIKEMNFEVLIKCRNLSELSVKECVHNVNWIGNLVGLKKLDLDFLNRWWIGKNMSKLEQLEQLVGLEHFSLGNWAGDGSKWLETMKELKSLELVNCSVEGRYEGSVKLKHLNLRDSIAEGIRVSEFVNLESLNLGRGGEIRNLEEISGLIKLKRLVLSGCWVRDAEYLKKLVELEDLEMSNAVMTEKGMRNVGDLNRLKHLDISDLVWENYGEELRMDALKELKGLEYLDLSVNGLDEHDDGIKVIVSNFVELKHLRLGWNSFTDVSWILGMDKLECLNLKYNDVTIDNVKKLIGLRGLKELYLDGCDGIDIKEMYEFFERIGVKVISLFYSKTSK